MMILNSGVCFNTVKVWRVIGVLVLILKVLVPVLLVITSVMPLFNALVAGNAEATKKAWITIGKKLAAGVIVFFIPSLVNASVKLLVGADYETEDVSYCVDCFSSPGSSECVQHVKAFDDADKKEAEEFKENEKEQSEIGNGSVNTNEPG